MKAHLEVLLGFVHYIKDASICQGILFIKTMIVNTGEAVYMYDKVFDCFDQHGICDENILSGCTDGAPSMIGKSKGFVSRLKNRRNVSSIHCILHRENLVAKKLGQSALHDALKCVVKCSECN